MRITAPVLPLDRIHREKHSAIGITTEKAQLNSNHQETSDKPTIHVILQNSWPLLWKTDTGYRNVPYEQDERNVVLYCVIQPWT